MTQPTPRIYGMADDDNRQTPASEGFRGERTPAVDDPALRHDVATGSAPVAAQETSGSAFVEASGGAEPPRRPDAPADGEEAAARAS